MLVMANDGNRCAYWQGGYLYRKCKYCMCSIITFSGRYVMWKMEVCVVNWCEYGNQWWPMIHMCHLICVWFDMHHVFVVRFWIHGWMCRCVLWLTWHYSTFTHPIVCIKWVFWQKKPSQKRLAAQIELQNECREWWHQKQEYREQWQLERAEQWRETQEFRSEFLQFFKDIASLLNQWCLFWKHKLFVDKLRFSTYFHSFFFFCKM